VNGLSRLREKLGYSKRYRESFAASVVKRMIPLQIRVLRREHDWSQAQLAKESNLTQGAISRAEDPDYGNLTINTLVRIASGFDCAFIGRFVSFSDLGRWYTALEDERALKVPSFGEDIGFIERKAPTAAQVAHCVPQPSFKQGIGVPTDTSSVPAGGALRLLPGSSPENQSLQAVRPFNPPYESTASLRGRVPA
jgi:transcriptional regulator with XRE-family HTH domain